LEHPRGRPLLRRLLVAARGDLGGWRRAKWNYGELQKAACATSAVTPERHDRAVLRRGPILGKGGFSLTAKIRAATQRRPTEIWESFR